MVQEIMTSEQAAQYLQLGIATLKRQAREGRIPAAKIGRAWRFRKVDLDEFLARGGTRYETTVDQGLLDASREALADSSQEWVSLEQAKKDLGL